MYLSEYLDLVCELTVIHFIFQSDHGQDPEVGSKWVLISFSQSYCWYDYLSFCSIFFKKALFRPEARKWVKFVKEDTDTYLNM